MLWKQVRAIGLMVTVAAVFPTVFANGNNVLRQFAYWLIGVAIALGVIGLLLSLKPWRRRKIAASGQSGLFVVQGAWRQDIHTGGLGSA